MELKLQKLHKLVQEARSKIELLQAQTSSLRTLNYKLHSLLSIFELLKIPNQPPQHIPPETDQLNIEHNNSNQILKDSSFFNASFSKSIHLDQQSSYTEEKYTIDSIKKKIREININRKFIENSEKIIEVINEHKDGLSIDIIMRRSGVSKYRCVEIINEFMKCLPQILIKRYENKLYVYQLNL